MPADFYRLIFFFSSTIFSNSSEWQEAQAKKLEPFCS
jgi:hypothetical protein